MPSEGARRGTVSFQDQPSDRHRKSAQPQSDSTQDIPHARATPRPGSTPPYSQNPLADQFKSDQEPAQDQRRRRQPLSEAVNDAFDQSDVVNKVDPDLVAVITSQVIQNLKLNGLGLENNSPPKPPTVVAQPIPKNTSSSSSSSGPAPPRDVYTPPSPIRDEPYSLNSLGTESFPPSLGNSFENNFDGHMDDRSQGRLRPAGPLRLPTDDQTTLERIWRPLFSSDGNSTARLGQFLRGLALHIIEEYEPTFSLVITPDKMAKFYNNVKLSREIYPWQAIFGGKVTNSSLSHLYRDLKCQHHFVQAGIDDKPTIPALTPAGFECWMTHVIRAHPDLEFDRFAKVALDMPISNAEDRRERFPKQLSRRLFPAYADGKIRELLEDSILADPAVELLRTASPISTIPVRQQSSISNSAPVPDVPLSEQRDQLYDHAQRKSPPPTDDNVTVETPPAVTIERERKPYYAQPGGGKIPADAVKSDAGLQRSNTTSSQHRSYFDGPDDPKPRVRFRSNSTTAAPAPRRRQSPTKSEYSNRSSAADPPAYSHRTSVYESDDDSHRLSRQQSREQRARQHIVESTQPRAYDETGTGSRGGSISNAPTYHPPSSSRYA